MTLQFLLVTVLLVVAVVGGWRIAAPGQIDGAEIARLVLLGVAMVVVPGAFGCEADDLLVRTDQPGCVTFQMTGCAALVVALVSAIRRLIDSRKR